MMFVAPSAISRPIESTVGIVPSALRLTICCNDVTIAAAATTGSVSVWGSAPCPPVPRTVMRSSSLEAIYCPARKPKRPAGISAATCSPTKAATS